MQVGLTANLQRRVPGEVHKSNSVYNLKCLLSFLKVSFKKIF